MPYSFLCGLFGVFPLHALYPLMKRVTNWPQAWLGKYTWPNRERCRCSSAHVRARHELGLTYCVAHDASSRCAICPHVDDDIWYPLVRHAPLPELMFHVEFSPYAAGLSSTTQSTRAK